jgi:hypothetical protein
MLTKISISKLTQRLSLPASGTEQDWDIELADKTRLGAFLAAYEDPSTSADDKFALMALLLASVDQHLGDNATLPGEWDRVVKLLAEQPDLHREQIEYWARTEENDPEGWFCLTPHIRDVSLT